MGSVQSLRGRTLAVGLVEGGDLVQLKMGETGEQVSVTRCRDQSRDGQRTCCWIKAA